MLVPILSIPESRLLEADPEFADYYRTELAPRLNSSNFGVAHEDTLLVDLDDDPEPELCVAAAWRNSSFLHDLRFVAVLDRHRSGTWSIASFQKLLGGIEDAFVVDLDRDGDSEFVVSWYFPSGHPVFELLVVSNGGETLATHVVRSSYRPVTLLAADAWGPPMIVTWGDGPSGYAGAVDGELLRWSMRGFSNVGDVALPW